MLGKIGTDPNVGNLESRPLAPSLHATVAILPAELSYVGSYETVIARAEAATRSREKSWVVNLIFNKIVVSSSGEVVSCDLGRG